MSRGQTDRTTVVASLLHFVLSVCPCCACESVGCSFYVYRSSELRSSSLYTPNSQPPSSQAQSVQYGLSKLSLGGGIPPPLPLLQSTVLRTSSVCQLGPHRLGLGGASSPLPPSSAPRLRPASWPALGPPVCSGALILLEVRPQAPSSPRSSARQELGDAVSYGS